MRVPVWALVGVAVFSSSAATAQNETVLEEITVSVEGESESGGDGAQASGGPKGPTIAQESTTATKTDTPILETPRSVSVVTEQRMEDQGVQTLQDALVYNSGVYGATYGYDTRGDWSLVRGLPPEEYRDGLKRNFGFYNDVRPHPYTLERVEILKGPASVLYGQGSAGGIVNVISKRPKDVAYREAFVEYGSFDRKEVGLDMTGPVDEYGKLLYRIVGVWRDSDTQVDHVEDDAYVLAPSLTWRPTLDTSLTILGNFQRNESGSSIQFFPWEGTIFPAPNGRIPTHRFISEPGWDRYDTEQAAVTAILDHRFNHIWSLSAAARYSDSKADYDTMYPVFPPMINPDGRTIDRVAYMSDAKAQIFVSDVRLNAKFATGAFDHRLGFGFDYQDATTENDFHYGLAGSIDLYDPVYGTIPTDLPYYDNDPETTRQAGVYIHNQIRFGAGWIASLGLRYDLATDPTDHTDEALSKDAGLMYAFANGISPYVSYSESFVPLVQSDFFGKPFKPIEGQQYEAGIKYQPPGTPSIITASVFQIDQENMLVSDPDNALNQIQTGEARIRGFEVEAQTRWQDFELLAGYTHLDTKDVSGYRLPSVPEHMAFGWLTYRPQGGWEGIKTGVGLRYVGRTWDGVDDIHTPPYVLADAMIGYETPRWSVALVGRNLFDNVHITTCLARGDCFYGERRSVALNLSTRF